MVQKGLRIRLGRAHMLVITPGKIALYLGVAVLAVFMALPASLRGGDGLQTV